MLAHLMVSHMEKDRIYTLSQVSQHGSKEDCWISINGRVLDVTRFLVEHPGGEEILIDYAGKDATEAFEAIGHSKAACKLVMKFQVGYLQGYSIKLLDDNLDNKLPEDKKQMEAYVIKDDLKLKHYVMVEFLLPLVVAGVYLYYPRIT